MKVSYPLLMILLFSVPVTAAEWVPPGFESLNDPQTTLVDLSFGGEVIGSVMVNFTQETLQFIEPESVTALIPDLIDPLLIAQLMQRDFSTNTQRLCYSGFQLDCGTLSPDDVDIIFDRDRLTLWLFIAPAYLQTRAPQDVRFLPDADAGASFYSANALYFSGSPDTDYVYNLYTNAQFAWGENHLVARTSLTEESVLVDQLSLGRNYRGRHLELGLFRGNAESFSFFPTAQFLGLNLESSLLSLQNTAQYQGTQITLFLPTRSRVELFSEGRLMSARDYDSGNQIIDTSLLPGGSYELEIHITDASGSTRVEYQYFSKTSRLPPIDSPQYFLQVGRQYQTGIPLSEQTDTAALLRSGFNRRLGDNTGLRAGMSVSHNSWLIETGVFRMGRGWEVQAGVARDNLGARGIEAGMTWRPWIVSIMANYRKVSGGSPNSVLRQDRTQSQISLELPIGSGSLSFFSRSLSSSVSKGNDINRGIRWRSDSWRGARSVGNASLEIAQYSGKPFYLLNLSWRIGRNNGNDTFSPQWIKDENESSIRGTLESSWQPRGEPTTVLSVRANKQTQESVEARLHHEGKGLGGDLTMRRDLTTRTQTTFGNFSNSFAIAENGLSLSGARSAESGFAVSVEGGGSQEIFDVLVDGVARTQVKSGERTLLPLSPYRSYSIELRAAGDKIITLDKGAQERVLYPGNIIGLHWEAATAYIGYGKLVDENGEGISNGLLENASGLAITEQDGLFQAELLTTTHELIVRRRETSCVAQVPAVETERLLNSLGTLICREMEK